jgi:hypothetical protein
MNLASCLGMETQNGAFPYLWNGPIWKKKSESPQECPTEQNIPGFCPELAAQDDEEDDYSLKYAPQDMVYPDSLKNSM